MASLLSWCFRGALQSTAGVTSLIGHTCYSILLPHLIITITNSSNFLGVFAASFFTNHSVQF